MRQQARHVYSFGIVLGSLLTLFVLALPIACIAWTVTHEELFREPREWCADRSRHATSVLTRKFFYVFTCEYCVSHYVALGMLVMTRFTLGAEGWRGYLIAEFALVWIANIYMTAFGRLRVDIKLENAEARQLALTSDAASSVSAGPPVAREYKTPPPDSAPLPPSS
jgi:hypothetical protein